MEIRPYRSQVRETATREPLQRPNTAMAQTYAAYGDMISRTGQTVSNSFNQWNDAIEKRRNEDFKIASEAVSQDIDLYIDNAMNEFNKYLDERGRNPSAVLYEDNKAADEVYSYQMQLARENALGKITDPRLKQAAEIYFNQKKMAAGMIASQSIDQHKKNAAATTIGRSWDKAEENAISAVNEKDKDNYILDVSTYIGKLVDLGVIAPEKRDEAFKDAKNRINVGRAKNVIQGSDIVTGRQFIDSISDKLDEKERNAIEDFYKDYWNGQKIVLEKGQSDAVNKYMKDIANDTFSQQEADNDPALDMHIELNMTTDWHSLLKKTKEAQDKAKELKEIEDALHASEAEAQQAINEYITLINSGKATTADAQKAAADIRLKPNAKTGQNTDYTVPVNRAFEYYFKWGTGEGGSGSVSLGGDKKQKSYLPDVWEIAKNNKWSKDAKNAVFLELWTGLLNENPYLTNTDYSAALSIIDNSDRFTDPRIKNMATLGSDMVAKLNKDGKTQEANDLQEALTSFFRVVGDEAYYKIDKNGQKVQISTVESDKIIEDAINTFNNVLIKNNVLEALRGTNLSDNPAIFDKDGNGYTMRVDGQYDRMKSALADVDWYSYTDEGQGYYTRLEAGEKKIIGEAVGRDINGYKMVVYEGKATYVSPDKLEILYIDLKNNKPGKYNIYRSSRKAVTDKHWTTETVTPPIIAKAGTIEEYNDAWKPGSTAVSEAVTNLDMNKVMEQGKEYRKKVKDVSMPGSEVRQKIVSAVRGEN